MYEVLLFVPVPFDPPPTQAHVGDRPKARGIDPTPTHSPPTRTRVHARASTHEHAHTFRRYRQSTSYPDPLLKACHAAPCNIHLASINVSLAKSGCQLLIPNISIIIITFNIRSKNAIN